MTALQELKQFVDKDLKLLGYEHQVILNKIERLLEIEKQQIIDAYNLGSLQDLQYPDENIINNGDQYYKQNYEL